MLFIFTGLPPPIPASKSTRVSTDLTTARLERQLDLKVAGSCAIRDMTVVTPDTLLVSKSTDKCVQLVDSRQGQVLSEVQLQDKPWRICLTDRNTAAVSMGAKKIQMIQVKDNKLTLGKVLTVSEGIQGITSSRNSLVVSYYKSPWLEVVSMDGKVLKQFDKTGKSQHFKTPAFMCTTPDGSILISDPGTNTITKMDESLNILQTFTSPLLEVPCGITAVTEDQILVCGGSNNSFLLLQPSTNTMSALLGKDDRIKFPHSLAYCPDQKMVYIAPITADKIKVYQIT